MVTAPARIALYVHDLAFTGVVRNTFALAAALAGDGHRVTIVTALPGGEAPPGVEHHALLGGARPSRRLEQVSVIPALRRQLRKERFDLLVSMGNHSHGVVWAANLGLAGTKLVYRISNDLARAMPGAPGGGTIKAGLRGRFARVLAKSADALVLVSPSLVADPALAAAPAGRVVVIPNGVDVDEARRRGLEPSPHPWLGGEEPAIVAIGRLAPQKNFETLVEAVALLNRRRPARLIILGESRDAAREELMAAAERHGIAGRLLMPGTTCNVFAWLARADVFALPSWWEGSPNVLLEAMAVGTPVVASRTAGNAADIVGHSGGFLIDPSDPVGMAGALARQLDPATRVAPGNRIEKFSLANTLGQWREFVRNLLDQALPPPSAT